MTVSELIEKLKEMPQDIDVVIGYSPEEYGLDEVELIDEERRSRIAGGLVHSHFVRLG